MKPMSGGWLAVVVAIALSTLSACSTNGGSGMFASHNKTVEYFRVFDIRTTASNDTMAAAASNGIERNIQKATLSTPVPTVAEIQNTPGRIVLQQPVDGSGAAAAARSPSCEGATWTANANPEVSGGENVRVVACLFPYKGGYHLDMYTAFTRVDGGWMQYPRQLTGIVFGTPEKWTEKTMLDVVRAIQARTTSQVVLVESTPEMVGTPWIDAVAGGL
jgi:hypothetical protein